jgi:DNA-binding transcriptional MerR regulator
MSDQPLPGDKLYYAIGEVAAMLDVNASLIRFWEKEFDVLRPSKNKKGNRLFTKKDIENLKLIHYLVKERGFTLEGARQKLKENPASAEKESELAARLQKVRSFLVELKDNL